MAQGSVGGGNQNNWKEDGIIYVTPPSGGLPFKKKNANPGARRNDSACWVADTPVTWKDKEGEDESMAKASTADVDGIDMLVTRDQNDNIIEYHPVITFFNEVMARLMQDNQKGRISDLRNRQKAIELWNYLEEKYLNPVAANGPI